jgi:starch phosphorylase
MRRVKQSLKSVSANFNCRRMVMEYATQLYEPAHLGYERICRDSFAFSREHVRWNREVSEKWPNVKFIDYGLGIENVSAGSSVPMHAKLDLAGLTPGDVRVEVVVGRVGAHGELEDTQVLTLSPTGPQQESIFTFGRDFAPFTTGRLGYALRVSPNHCDDPLNRPCNALLKWAGES